MRIKLKLKVHYKCIGSFPKDAAFKYLEPLNVCVYFELSV